MNTMTREVTGVEVTETMDYWYDIVTRKEYRVKVIRRVGPHQVEDQDGNLVQVTESVTFEASPPMGTPVIYIDGEKAVKADLVVEVTQTTESNGDKEYPLTITKWSGLHEIQDRQGRTVRVAPNLNLFIRLSYIFSLSSRLPNFALSNGVMR